MSRTGAVLVVLAVSILTAHRAAAEPVFVDDQDHMYDHDERCPTPDAAIGWRDCPNFGTWGTALESPYFAVNVGMNIRFLPRRPVAPTGMISERVTNGTIMPPSGGANDASYTFAEEVSFAMTHHLFFGLEIEISPTPGENSAPGAQNYAAGSELALGLQGSGRLLKLSAEVAAGTRFLESDNWRDDDEQFVLEARARAELWLSPWVTFGVAVGKSLLDHNDRMIGFSIGLHTYAYGPR